MPDEPADDRSSEPDAPAPDDLREAGSPFAEFARQRQAEGLSLEDVARQLKLAPRQVEALEAGDFARLPNGMFARGMLRNYARLLKLDAAPMLSELVERSNALALPEQAVVLPDPVPFADGARRVNFAYLAISVGVLIAVGVLAVEWMHRSSGTAKLEFVPAAQTPSAPQTMVSSIAPTPVIAAAQAEAQPQAEPNPAPARAQRRINLSFARESWVEITDRAGHRLISQLNLAGSEQALEGVPPFEVVIGNAHHVTFIYENRPIDLKPFVKVEVARFTLE